MNTCPLGAGALAGTTYPLDREYTAELLGFDEPTRNSMDSVSDRDYVIELLSALSTVMMHLSRFLRRSSSGTPMSTVLWKLTMHTAQAAVLCLRKRILILRSFSAENRPCVRRADVCSHNHEGDSSGLQ